MHAYDAQTLYDEYNALYGEVEAVALAVREGVLSELLAGGHAKAIVTARAKEPLELFKKQKRKKYEKPWAECADLVGARIIVGTLKDKSEVVRILENSTMFGEGEVEDQSLRSEPAEIRYRGLHVHLRGDMLRLSDGRIANCEVQVRTTAEHAWAEIEHRYVYKKGDIDDKIRRHFNRLLVLIEIFDAQLSEGVEMAKQLPGFQRMEFSQHLERAVCAFTDKPTDLALTMLAVEKIEAAGLGSLAELRSVVDEYLHVQHDEILRVFDERGPSSAGHNLSTDWILSQGESLLLLALLDKDEYRLSNALVGDDLYAPTTSLALTTGHAGFVRE